MALIEFTDLFKGLLFDMAKTVPTIVGALLLLFIGWFIGRVASRLVLEALKRFKSDEYFKLGKNVKLSEVIALLVAWIVYLAFIGTAVEFMGVTTLTLFFNNILGFLSRLLGGIVILVLGYLVAGYIQKQIKHANASHSEILSQAIFFFTLVITISMAFQVVGIPTDLLNGIIMLLVAGLSLGVAIALGLGLRDVVAKWARKYL